MSLVSTETVPPPELKVSAPTVSLASAMKVPPPKVKVALLLMPSTALEENEPPLSKKLVEPIDPEVVRLPALTVVVPV